MEKATEIFNRLKIIKGITKDVGLSRLLNVTPGTFGNYKQRNTIPYKKLLSICKDSNINLHWLVTGEGNKYIKPLKESCTQADREEKIKSINDILQDVDLRNLDKIKDELESKKTHDIINYWGLKAIYQTRQQMNRSADIAFKALENQLDIIAWGLKSFRDAKGKAIEEKISNGLKMRVVAPDPNSEYVKQREIDEKEVEGQIKNTIVNLTQWIRELKQVSPDPSNVQIKFYNSLPEDFYFRNDETLFIGPYLWGISSQQTISYEFKGGSKGFSYYTDYFDKLWNDKSFCKGVL